MVPDFPRTYDARREQMAPRRRAQDDARLYGFGFTLKQPDGTETYLPLHQVVVHTNVAAPVHAGVVEGCHCAMCNLHRKAGR